MVFPSHTNYLHADLQVLWENNGIVDMIGCANTGTSYSAPGHIQISLPALPAALEGKIREVKELKLFMEGKSEFYNDAGRYTPMRLHSCTLELASPSRPLLIPSSDPSHSCSQLQFVLPFDLRLPGWLPSSYENDMTFIGYGCVIEAIIGWAEPASVSPNYGDSIGAVPEPRGLIKPKSRSVFESVFSNSTLLPSSSKKSVSKWQPFSIRRHRLHPPIGSTIPEISERHYTLRPEAGSTSPIECVVTVPEFVDINSEERNLKVSLRIRARRDAIIIAKSRLQTETESTTAAEEDDDINQLESVPMERSDSKCKKEREEALTHMIELGMEVEETEWLSSTPSRSFRSTFPIPETQPSRYSSQHKLISPPSSYASNNFGFEECPFKETRTRSCFLSEDGNQRNFFFSNDGLGLTDKWRKVNVVLPMPTEAGEMGSKPQPEINSPFLRIKHALKFRVVCRNAGNTEDAVVLLSTPIRFSTCPITMPTPIGKPHLASLPSYIQLFHENGELRECDPLPLYTAHESGLQVTIPLSEPDRSDCSIPAPSYESIIPCPSVFSSPSIPSSSTLNSSSGAASASASFCRSRSASLSPSGISSSSDLDALDEGERNLRGRSFSPASQVSDDDAMDLDGAGSGSAAGDSPSGARQGEEGILEGSMERLVREIGVKRTGRGNPMLTPLVVRQVL
ncbi:hypothetical protein I314_06673 [Cryptococcus bacillisporus CA1873]|uniref:Uncharacterized protein n=2 Tax=Cryptococcus gattii TaxID=552467 RepID=A0A0D0VRK7_CRYGA|nr:hypothetical protein I312_02464 [Cryptococcus bacillisporus CA1280]KIR57534.1 hypothetical protein I314_06673 [Cryptococcus bacillisporus CA1873]|eukprot:KIR57534.1 hypothetical protein I314_06673 [Cryptococcus gattii CA1873]